jgi:hypothetical protein
MYVQKSLQFTGTCTWYKVIQTLYMYVDVPTLRVIVSTACLSHCPSSEES